MKAKPPIISSFSSFRLHPSSLVFDHAVAAYLDWED